MDEICLRLFTDKWAADDVTPVMTLMSDDERRRMRRSIDDDDNRCAGHVSLISLFLAFHNDSYLRPATTTATTPIDSNVTATPTLSAASLIAEKVGQSVTFGLLPTVAVIGLIVNSLALAVTVSDTRCPLWWRLLRCLAVLVDVVLLTMFMVVVDVAAYFDITSLDVLNTLAALVGLLQYVQPWLLYITATYIHQMLLDERHKVPPQRRVRYPRLQLIAMTVAGAIYFTLYVPPIRLLLYRYVPGHSALCTVPLFNQWQLSVGLTATDDLFYYLCYDCLYTFVVYVAPIVPLYYRYRRLVDAIFRRDYQSVAMSSRSSAAAMCSWADVVSVTCGVHIITHCIKSTLLTMRLTEAIAVEKYMARGDVVFQLMNSIANVTVVLRPLCHLPVMLIYDRRLRREALREYAALVASVLPYVKCDDQSEYSDEIESVELDSIIADDDALDDDDDVDNAVSV